MSKALAGALMLVCTKCTRYGVFAAPTRGQAETQASQKGWAERQGKTICPKCPK